MSGSLAIGGLYAVAGLACAGGYFSALAFIGIKAHELWGGGAEWIVIAVCLLITAIGCMLVAHQYLRPSRRKSAAQRDIERSSDLPIEKDGVSTRDLVETLVREMPPAAWITVISAVTSGVVALGPRRIMRLVGTLAISALQSQAAAHSKPRTDT